MSGSASYALCAIKASGSAFSISPRRKPNHGSACREHQVGGVAQAVDESMDFRGQFAARSADRLVAVFFWAPPSRAFRACVGIMLVRTQYQRKRKLK
jgi:hypothetical protein